MNLITWALWGIIVIAIFAIINNSSVTGTNNINDQFAKINCPMPLYNSVDFLNGTIIDSRVNTHTGKNFGTYYQCFFDPHTMAFGRQGVTSISADYVPYNATSFTAFPNGWFTYVGDFIASFGFKVGAVVNLISYILTPINLNILGFTISSISGLVLMTVIAIYVLAYIPICIFMYKSISPFAT